MRKPLLLLFFTVVIFSLPLWAQKDTMPYTGTLNGSVMEEDGETPIAGVFITATPSQKPLVNLSTYTDAKGIFKIDLPPGSYIISFNGIAPDTARTTTITAKKTTYATFLISKEKLKKSKGVRLVPVKD